jgi:hypothetical protein
VRTNRCATSHGRCTSGKVQRRLRFHACERGPHVPRQSHYLADDSVGGVGHALSNRILAREEALRERLVNHHDARRGNRIAFAERMAAQQWNANRAEIARAHASAACAWMLRTHIRSAFDPNPVTQAMLYKVHARRNSRGVHARYRAHVSQDFCIEAIPRLRGPITVGHQVERNGHHVLRAKPRFHRGPSPSGSEPAARLVPPIRKRELQKLSAIS